MDQSGDSNGSGNAMAIQQVLTKAIDENLDSDDDNSKSKVVKLKELLEESKRLMMKVMIKRTALKSCSKAYRSGRGRDR